MTRPYMYDLDEDRNPVPLDPGDVSDGGRERVWSEEFRRVGKDMVQGFLVSTVFIPYDMNYTGVGPPILWETMIFDHRDHVEGMRRYGDEFQYRYSSEAEAKRGHALAVQLVHEKLAKGLNP